MHIFEDEWLCMDMDIKSRLLLKRIRRNHMFHENIRRKPRGFSAVGSIYGFYLVHLVQFGLNRNKL